MTALHQLAGHRRDHAEPALRHHRAWRWPTQPWSGYYSIGKNAWVMAQTTQFTAPGWQYLDSSSGYIGGNRNNGSYVSLKSTEQHRLQHDHRDDGRQRRADAQLHRHRRPVHRHRARVVDQRQLQQPGRLLRAQRSDITPSGGSFSLTVQPGYVYTHHHHHRPGQGHRDQPGAGHAERCRTATTSTATPPAARRSTSWTMQGAFEVAALRRRPHRAVRAPDVARRRRSTGRPATPTRTPCCGDLSWSNYTVSSDVLLEKSGYAELHRPGQHPATTTARQNSNAYYLRVTDTGAWSILQQQHQRQLAHPGQRHRRGAGHRPLAHPGADLQRQHASPPPSTAPPSARVTDSTCGAGQVGFGTGQGETAQFDNLSITPVGGTGGGPTGELRGAGSGRCLDVNGASQTDGTQSCRSGTATAAPTSSGRSTSSNQLTVYGNKCLDVPGTAPPPAPGSRSGPATAAPTSSGASTPTARSSASSPGCAWTSPAPAPPTAPPCELWTCNGGSNQQWTR